MTLQIILKKHIDDFCMTKDSWIQFYGGGFRRKLNIPFYPNFGPYILLEQIAEDIINKRASESVLELFDVKLLPEDA